MTDIEKAASDGLAIDRRNSKIPEEVQYERIVDRQKKRRIRKKAAKGEDNNEEDNHKELLEWVDYYKHNADSKKTLKRRSLDMFSRCEEFVREAVKEDTKSDDDEEEEEADGKTGNSIECTCDYDVECPACTTLLEDEKEDYL